MKWHFFGNISKNVNNYILLWTIPTPRCLFYAFSLPTALPQRGVKALTTFLFYTWQLHLFKEVTMHIAHCTDWRVPFLSFAASCTPCSNGLKHHRTCWIIGSLYASPYFPTCSCVHFLGQIITSCFHMINNTVVSSCLCLMKYRILCVTR